MKQENEHEIRRKRRGFWAKLGTRWGRFLPKSSKFLAVALFLLLAGALMVWSTTTITDTSVTTTSLYGTLGWGNLSGKPALGTMNKTASCIVDSTGNGDHTTIQGCIDEISGGLIYVTEGTYTITSSITLKSNITLTGSGADTIIFNGDGTNADMIVSENPSSRIHISNFKIDGNRDNQTESATVIMLTGCSDCTVSNVLVKEFEGVGIYILSGNNVVIDSSTVKNGNHGGIVFDAGTNNSKIVNSHVYNTSGEGLYGSCYYIANEGHSNPNYNNQILSSSCVAAGQYAIQLGYETTSTVISGFTADMMGVGNDGINIGANSTGFSINGVIVDNLNAPYSIVRVADNVTHGVITGVGGSTTNTTQRTGLYIDSTADYINHFGNDWTQMSTAITTEAGANTNQATEISGGIALRDMDGGTTLAVRNIKSSAYKSFSAQDIIAQNDVNATSFNQNGSPVVDTTGATFTGDISVGANLAGFSNHALKSDGTRLAVRNNLDSAFSGMIMQNIYLYGEIEYLGGVSADGTGKVVCVKSGGELGSCTSAINSTGHCTCS